MTEAAADTKAPLIAARERGMFEKRVGSPLGLAGTLIVTKATFYLSDTRK